MFTWGCNTVSVHRRGITELLKVLQGSPVSTFMRSRRGSGCQPASPPRCFHVVTSVGGVSSESWAELSERFGTGGVGHGVRQRLLRVAAVVVNLEQDGDVHEDLQQPAGPELHGGLGEQEVDGFKGVAAGPHQHHLDAGGDEKSRELKIDALLNQHRHQNTVKLILMKIFPRITEPECILNLLSPGSDTIGLLNFVRDEHIGSGRKLHFPQ